MRGRACWRFAAASPPPLVANGGLFSRTLVAQQVEPRQAGAARQHAAVEDAARRLQSKPSRSAESFASRVRRLFDMAPSGAA